jgi:hypothetical protein
MSPSNNGEVAEAQSMHGSGCRQCFIRVFALVALLTLASAGKADDVKSFYAGKTLKIIVGLPPAGGADA